ncbi:hypothetical protein ACRS8G_09710 [Staphylococcus epidermidis]|uniref:hypothetical protein n=1 Tax=Staphylococcus epidermidis TaxID=1282 RepID=UPI00193C0FC0|nr:hypothetical protein [Staphylococcus epidermidis]MBM6127399.1 hypothetical protein [Staphylococcus epidermidis]MBM6134135.1 hypothetical protein [Staphylococcus epidermidis]MBM6136369.1 hypothetical protein [Staphylococcus epidermidis]MBM6141044.1 hypothetical protein [Staphylococcus epidermidis]MBM6143276.1 hypothetical protein [Staphylococcus epidermidis]
MTMFHILGLIIIGALIADYVRLRKEKAKLRVNVSILAEHVMKDYGAEYTYKLINYKEEQ